MGTGMGSAGSVLLRGIGPKLVNQLNSSSKQGPPSFKVSRIPYTGGSIETVNLDTTELMKEASIYARDLFFTLNLTSRQERLRRGIPARRTVCAIQSRKKKIILLSFGKVRAVASLHDIMLFDAHNPAVREFANELRAVFASGELHGDPSELVFLECVLRDTVDSYHRRLRLFEPIGMFESGGGVDELLMFQTRRYAILYSCRSHFTLNFSGSVDSFLDKVDNNDITSPDAVVHQLAPLKDALQSFEIQVRQSQECLENLLNHDDEMLALLLTEQNTADQTGEEVDFSRHEHVELLLGVYARQISNINMDVNYLLQRLQSKQEFFALALSGYRNRMIQLNVHLGITALSVGFSTTVAGFFGMNLISGVESSPTAFTTVVVCSSLGSLCLALLSLNQLSGKAMHQRAKMRLEEMETMTSALSDMGALDHALKSSVERGDAVSKEQFRIMLKNSRQSKEASTNEVDLLFDVFDKIKDGSLTASDFQHLDSPSSLSSSWGGAGRKTK